MHSAILGGMFGLLVCAGGAALIIQGPPDAADAGDAPASHVFVTNERSGDVTVIDPRDNQVVATIPVGKRPRGICASPDGSKLFVALSGTPIISPAEKQAKGADAPTPAVDPKADGIGVIDATAMKLIDILPSGKDP